MARAQIDKRMHHHVPGFRAHAHGCTFLLADFKLVLCRVGVVLPLFLSVIFPKNRPFSCLRKTSLSVRKCSKTEHHAAAIDVNAFLCPSRSSHDIYVPQASHPGYVSANWPPRCTFLASVPSPQAPHPLAVGRLLLPHPLPALPDDRQGGRSRCTQQRAHGLVRAEGPLGA